MKKAPSPITAKEPSDSLYSNTLNDAIKAKLVAGSSILVVDYPPEQRQEVIGILAALKDQLPIITGWQTLRQSYLSETRTRARRYHIPEALLIGGML